MTGLSKFERAAQRTAVGRLPQFKLIGRAAAQSQLPFRCEGQVSAVEPPISAGEQPAVVNPLPAVSHRDSPAAEPWIGDTQVRP